MDMLQRLVSCIIIIINVTVTFGVEKQEWCGYPMVKKIWKICCIHFHRIHECGR